MWVFPHDTHLSPGTMQHLSTEPSAFAVTQYHNVIGRLQVCSTNTSQMHTHHGGSRIDRWVG